MRLSVEWWNDHPIRFVGEGDHWDAIAKDVTDALGYQNGRDAIERHVATIDRATLNMNTVVDYDAIRQPGNPNVAVLSEYGIYSLIFGSHMEQAEEFRRWTYQVLKQLRLSAGLQGYQALRMLDKRIQQQAMARLEPVSNVDYIKANAITDKAVSNMYGFNKMVKKSDMTPAMLKDRPAILNSVVDLMNIKKRFGLNFSVSQTIYDSLNKPKGDENHGATVSSR